MPLRFSLQKVLISFSLATMASVLCLLVPAYRGVTVQRNSAHRVSPISPQVEMAALAARNARLAEVNGSKTYFLLAIPLALAALPLLFRSRTIRVLSAVLITGWVVIGAASIGLFYIPSAIMMIWSAFAKSG